MHGTLLTKMSYHTYQLTGMYGTGTILQKTVAHVPYVALQKTLRSPESLCPGWPALVSEPQARREKSEKWSHQTAFETDRVKHADGACTSTLSRKFLRRQ